MASMIATSASHQSSSSAPSALSKFTTRDKLLLAQAVHELGTSPPDWGKVAGLMLAHPLVREPARLEEVHAAGITIGRVFGTRECERAWTALMRQRGLIVDPSEAAALHRSAAVQARNRKEARGAPPRMDKRSMLVLAQLLYAERMEEIRRNIKDKEVQYRELVSELEDLNSGKLDDRIAAELRGEIAAAPLRKRAQLPSNAAASAEPTRLSLSPSAPMSSKPIQAQKARASISDLETSPTSAKTKAADPPDGSQSATSTSTIAVAVADDDVAGKEEGSQSSQKEKRKVEDAVDIAVGDGTHAEVHNEDASMEDAAVSAKEESKEESEGPAPSPPAAETKTPIPTPTKTPRAIGKRKRGGDQEDKDGADEAEEPAPDAKVGRPKSKRARSDMPTESATTEVMEVDDDGDEQAEEESPEKSASRASNAPRRTRRTTRGAPEDEEAEAEQAPPSETSSPARRKARSRRNVSQEASIIPDTGEDGDEIEEEEQDDDDDEEEEDEEEEEEVDEAEQPGNSSGEDEEDNARSRATSPASSRVGVEGATPASSTRSGRVRGAPGRRQRGVSNASSSTVQTPAIKTRAKREPASGRKTRGEAKEKDKANISVESVDKEDRKGKRKTSEKVLLMLLQEVANHMHGNLFQGPIKDQDAPDYYSVIRDPWDLRRIKTAIKAGEILSALELHRKLNIMFANALMYNRPGTEMHRMAKEMWQSAEEAMKRFCA